MCLCPLAAREQRPPRAAGNQSRGVPAPKEGRRIREHVAVTAADQRQRQPTEELELVTPQTPPPAAATILYSMYSPPPHTT